MISTNGFLLFVIALLYHSTLGIADTIQGCGGFVEASSALIKSRSPATAKLDYSNVTVELRTLDGLVKDQTQCAPNGYYFIPIYDKWSGLVNGMPQVGLLDMICEIARGFSWGISGLHRIIDGNGWRLSHGSFVIKIKGPEGWSYAPEQVPVVVDYTGCNANEDINFLFTGFTLSGRVVGAVGGDSCVHESGGPSNVNVELLSSNGDVVSSVLTSSTGSYLFKNIIPGKYNIRASHRNLNIEVEGSAEVELGFDNGVVDDILFVSGYDIRGLVVAQGNPILGVHFYLYSDDVLELDCPYESGNAPGMSKALCHSVSDADGMFTFKSIPCGIYNLVPFYKGENTIFDVSPPSMLVSVQHDHAIAPQKFQVTGFSVGGRVVDDNGTGVDAASIVVDGQERSITDKEGYYKLDQVTSKRYSIEAKKDHYKFEKLNDFLVLPNMASIADIKAVSYDLCGIAQTVGPDYKAKVALTHGPENVKPQVKQTDESGNFCFEVPPGEYHLSAFAATPDSAPELLFSPPHIDVNVNKPLLSVKFYQAQVNVRGSVVCKEKCGSSVSVVLIRLDGNRKEERTSSLTNQNSEFIFSNVLPGRYRVEVKNHSPSLTSGEDIWCWEQNSINVDVGAEDVEDMTFIQKGFMVSVISSHEVDSFLISADGSRVNLKIKKGSQRICVESSGVHELQFADSFISFGSNILRFDTHDLLPIYLKGEKYLLKGHINVESNENLPDNIAVDILDNGISVDGTVARLESSEIDQSRGAVYLYSVWANFGRKLIFIPRDSRDDGEKKMLFYPRQQYVSVTSDGCQVPIFSFSGRLGLYIEGSVLPPLSHVHIRLVAERESHISLLKQGDIAFETMTGADGLFLAGPLYDDISYSTEASKPGYYVKKVGSTSFSCQKLGQISVRLYFKEDINDSFPSVLLSLSGEDGYRNNSITGVGGTFVFDGLFPGSFYLRPLLKEYAFSPPAQPIEIGSGESKEVIFHATRVAFSAFGKVTLLSGQPKDGVYVEARAESKGFYEETKTDISGSFRLRGLQPDSTYVIKVARKGELDSAHIERASPGSLAVKIGYEDVKDLDFVVFELPDMTILSGHVEGKNIKEMHLHIRVEIRPASDPSTVESIFPLPISNFFQVKDLPKGKHLLQLRSALPSGNHRFVSEVIEIDLERQPQIHVGPLSFRIEEDMYKQELTPAPVYPLVVGLSVIALFISMPRLKDLYQATVGISFPGSFAAAKKDVKKLGIRKKTY